MELSIAAQWAEIIGLITILGAAIYSYFQIREMKRVRQGAAALSLSHLALRAAGFNPCELPLRTIPFNGDSKKYAL